MPMWEAKQSWMVVWKMHTMCGQIVRSAWSTWLPFYYYFSFDSLAIVEYVCCEFFSLDARSSVLVIRENNNNTKWYISWKYAVCIWFCECAPVYQFSCCLALLGSAFFTQFRVYYCTLNLSHRENTPWWMMKCIQNSSLFFSFSSPWPVLCFNGNMCVDCNNFNILQPHQIFHNEFFQLFSSCIT